MLGALRSVIQFVNVNLPDLISPAGFVNGDFDLSRRKSYMSYMPNLLSGSYSRR